MSFSLVFCRYSTKENFNALRIMFLLPETELYFVYIYKVQDDLNSKYIFLHRPSSSSLL